MHKAGFSSFLLSLYFFILLPLVAEAAALPHALPSAAASPAPVTVADLNDGLLLGPYLRIFEDKTGAAQWKDVLAGKHDTDFKPQNKAVPNFGSTHSTIWAIIVWTSPLQSLQGAGAMNISSNCRIRLWSMSM